MRVVWTLIFVACGAVGEPLDERDCELRQAFFPDTDGDGVGEASQMVIACTAPEGFVTVPPATTTGDTGALPDTGTP